MFSFNVFELEIPPMLRINQIFNVENLTPYRPPIDYPIVISDPSSLTFACLPPLLVDSLSPRKHHIKEIEDIL